MNNKDNIKVFISYAHTNAEHKTRVKFIASELRVNYGLNVILDEWSFRKGQDLNKAMEDSGTKSDIILIIGDKNYVDKANERMGGVGRESIIFSDTYMKNVKSDKYTILYAFTEKDEEGDPIIPNYMKGINSFDLTDKSKDLEVIDEIGREIYEEPKEIAPPIGSKPDFSKNTNMQSIRKMKLVDNIDNKLLKDIIEDIKAELKEIDSNYKNYQDINVKRDFSKIQFLLKHWIDIVKKINKPKDIAKIYDKLLNTLKLDRNENDATRMFIRISFNCTVAYAIDTDNFSLIDELIKYDYTFEGREISYQDISTLGNPYFIEAECIPNGIPYKSRYFEIEEKIIRNTDFNIVDVLEADIFIEFISLLNNQNTDSLQKKWTILDNVIYSQVIKHKLDFKFLKSFKRESTVNRILKILNLNDLTEFEQLIKNCDDAKLFSVIEKEKIISQK